ncbi:ABC transporter substrate-binding protein [Bacillus suaedae]|uniref:Iron-siderophore ABC transporter substrate-binding protein n=1 Tax=Halalkalibacter suaedae TaxID=2822140 RepID=A0A940WXU7_9BACI|nr:iron-siderophore ABC transporter substrate-binding protein [Bacillus suaedae]MBP3952682.1 iron-siderophore ABC transporter substrate-binding protein [Bacillus suaedae]
MQGKQRLKIFLFVLLAFTIFLTGCNQEDAAPAEDTEPETTEETTEEATEETSDVREIEHAMGTTPIEGTPTKIVTLYQGATDAAVALGIKPVGVVESWVQQPTYEYLRDDLEGVAIVGLENQPNLEEIAKLKPDLIIASKLRHEEIYEQLEAIAPTVTHESVEFYKETLELVGQATNKEAEADQILADWDARIADFQGKVSEKLGDQWPLNVSLLNFRADHARIYYQGFAGAILEELGFTRPENQQVDEWGVQLQDKESIPEMNADVFYIFNEDDEAVKKTFDEWTSHPLWENLDAVKNDQVFMVDEVTWNMAGGILAANLMLDDIYERFELEQ